MDDIERGQDSAGEAEDSSDRDLEFLERSLADADHGRTRSFREAIESLGKEG